MCRAGEHAIVGHNWNWPQNNIKGKIRVAQLVDNIKTLSRQHQNNIKKTSRIGQYQDNIVDNIRLAQHWNADCANTESSNNFSPIPPS